MEKIKATVFLNGELTTHPSKLEVWLLEHGTTEYAQYNEAPFVRFIGKGKQLESRWIKGYKPFAVIVKGWGHPDNPEWFSEPREENGMIIRTTKYLSHDDNFQYDFNEWFEKQDFEVIADYRWTKEVVKNE